MGCSQHHGVCAAKPRWTRTRWTQVDQDQVDQAQVDPGGPSPGLQAGRSGQELAFACLSLQLRLTTKGSVRPVWPVLIQSGLACCSALHCALLALYCLLSAAAAAACSLLLCTRFLPLYGPTSPRGKRDQ